MPSFLTKQEFPRLKWIAKRDDWLGLHATLIRLTPTPYASLERKEAACAPATVVAVTPAQRDAIRDRYPDQPPEKFLYLPNGFDADLYEDFQPARNGRDNMVVTYYGTLYANPPYDISGYLDAVDSLPEAIRDKIETRFIGRIAVEAEAVLAGRKSKLVKMGFFPRDEGVRKLQESDYLLLAANDPTQHAGKLFDYLATGLPTLALSPAGGEVARLLRETGAGVAVNGKAPDEIRQMLLDAFARLQGQCNRFPTDRAAIAGFERRNLVAQLVRLTASERIRC